MRLPILSLVILGLSTFSSASAKGKIGIKDGKLSVGAADGSDTSKFDVVPPKLIDKQLVFERDTVLKLSFTVVDQQNGDEPIVPQQAHVQFKDEKNGEIVSLPVAVKSNGKARFDLKSAHLSPLISSTSGHLQLTLLLGSPAHTSLRYPLLSLTLPSSILTAPATHRHALPVPEGSPAFRPKQEIKHIFGIREEEKPVKVWKSAAGVILVLGPWVLLVDLIGKSTKNAIWKSPPFSTWIFLVSMAILDGLIIKYWINWTLGGFLPYFGAFSAISIYLGKIALSSLQARRLSDPTYIPAAPAVIPATTVQEDLEEFAEIVKEKELEVLDKVKDAVAERSAQGDGGGSGGGGKKKKNKK